MGQVNPVASQPSPQVQTEKESEGYSTAAKVAMAAGAVIVVGGLVWWVGPAVIGSAIMSGSGFSAQQGTSDNSSLGGQVSGAKIPSIDITDIDAFSSADIERIQQNLLNNPPLVLNAKFYEDLGVSIDHYPSDIGSALKIGQQICAKIWTPENLQHAETVITTWMPGQKIDVRFYRPFIEHICETDPIKKGTLLPKLEQIEQELLGSSVPREVKSYAKAAIMGKVNQELQKGVQQLYAKVFKSEDVPITTDRMDRRVLSALEGDKCEDVEDIQAFCELVESVFSRNPGEEVLLQGKFRKALKKIIENNPEQREFLPEKYRKWVI